MKHLSVKLGSLFIITVVLIGVYTLIYSQIFKLSLTEAFYSSTLIQTLNGKGDLANVSDEHKWIIASQSFIGYMITSGILIISMT